MNEWNLHNFQQFPAIFPIFSGIFLKISRILIMFCNSSWNSDKILTKFGRKFAKFIDFCLNEMKFHFILAKFWTRFLLEIWDLSGAKVYTSCRSRKMLKNEYLLAKIGFDTAENEPLKVWGNLFIISILSLVETFRDAFVFWFLIMRTRKIEINHQLCLDR